MFSIFRLMKRCDRPKHLLLQYVEKQLGEFEKAVSQDLKNHALIRLASHFGDASVLDAARIEDLLFGDWQSINDAESSAILAQAFEFIGKRDRLNPTKYNRRSPF